MADRSTASIADAKPARLLSGRALGKTYGPTRVLDGVDVAIRSGKVLALLGENGAGKSTVMKILSGIIPHGEHDGEILLDGVGQRFASTRAAEAAGIVLVPQELHVVPHLPIAENMFAGRLPGRFGLYDEAAAVEQAREALTAFDLNFDPRAPAATLSPSERRLIVLAAALQQSARVLILDEPTASLSETEASVLLEHLRRIRDSGAGIAYISHRLDEIAQIADSVTVLRNGRTVAEYDYVPERGQLVGDMLGTELRSVRAAAEVDRGPGGGLPVLKVQDFWVLDSQRRQRVENVSLEVHGGEIVGLYGLVGAGRSELARALFGAWSGTSFGMCEIAGTHGTPRTTPAAARRGLMLLPEDRKSQGILRGQSVAANMSASQMEAKGGLNPFIDRAGEAARVARLIDRLDVRPPLPDLPIEALSGGNQQKVLLGRCLIDGLKILILDEPTVGIDVGARRDIYQLIRELAHGSGIGILLISSDVDEVLTESDRVLVMSNRRIVREFAPGATAHDLLFAATGAMNR